MAYFTRPRKLDFARPHDTLIKFQTMIFFDQKDLFLERPRIRKAGFWLIFGAIVLWFRKNIAAKLLKSAFG
jgi:hypothetical protein